MCRRISYGSPKVAFDSIQYLREPFISRGLCIKMSGVLSYFARSSFSVSYWRPRALSQVESLASPQRPRAYWRGVPPREETNAGPVPSPDPRPTALALTDP